MVTQGVLKHFYSVWSTHMGINQLKYRLLVLMKAGMASRMDLTKDQRLAAGHVAGVGP